MSYVGNTNTTQAFTPAIDYFSGNGSTTAFTLSRPVASVAQVQAVVNNVAQNPSDAFTVSGNTITFTSAPSSGTNNIYVYYTSPITQVATLSQDPVITGDLNMGSTGARITGDFTNATVANRVAFQTSAADSVTVIGALPSGTAQQSNFEVYNKSDPSPANSPAMGQLLINSTEFSIRSSVRGTGTYLPMTFYTGGSERMRIDTSGNVGIGTGSPSKKLDVFNSGTTTTDFVVRNGTVSLLSFVDSGAGYTGTSTNHPLLFTTNNTERMRIDSSGNLLVGTTSVPSTGAGTNSTIVSNKDYSASFAQIINSTSTSGTQSFIQFGRGSSECGKITSTATNSTTYATSSDYRLKENISPMTGALVRVAALKPVSYRWKSDGTESEGFIAHELAEVVPQAVVGEKDALYEDGTINPQGIDTSFLVATLTAAIQEQQALITALTARIEALENK